MNADLQLPDIRIDEIIQRVNGLRRDLRQVKQCWDNRLILEERPVREHHLNGRVEAIFHGNWLIGADKKYWVVRVAATGAFLDAISPRAGVDVIHACDGNDWQEIVVFVPVAQVADSPKVKISAFAGLYVCEDERCKVGEGLLYRNVLRVSFKVFPFVRLKREVGHSARLVEQRNCSCYPIIQGFPKVVENVANDAAKMLRDWLFGPVGQLIEVWFDQQHNGTRRFDPNLIQVSGKGGGLLDKRINVAVGPFDL